MLPLLLLMLLLPTAAGTAGVVVDKLSSADEGSEAAHVCTMLMETLVVLLNHEVSKHREGHTAALLSYNPSALHW